MGPSLLQTQDPFHTQDLDLKTSYIQSQGSWDLSPEVEMQPGLAAGARGDKGGEDCIEEKGGIQFLVVMVGLSSERKGLKSRHC